MTTAKARSARKHASATTRTFCYGHNSRRGVARGAFRGPRHRTFGRRDRGRGQDRKARTREPMRRTAGASIEMGGATVELRSKSWRSTIVDQRRRMALALKETPSLVSVMRDANWRETCSLRARAARTGDSTPRRFPSKDRGPSKTACDPDFWPDYFRSRSYLMSRGLLAMPRRGRGGGIAGGERVVEFVVETLVLGFAGRTSCGLFPFSGVGIWLLRIGLALESPAPFVRKPTRRRRRGVPAVRRESMRIAIVGVGAIGGLLAASLARAGEEVSVVARGAISPRSARRA